MWKLTLFFFRLNFWRGLGFTFLCVFGMLLTNRLITNQTERDFILFSTVFLSSIFFPAFFGFSGVSSNLSWIHALPLKRKNVFLMDYSMRILGVIQMGLFHFIPLILCLAFLNKKGFFGQSYREIFENIKTSGLHAFSLDAWHFTPSPEFFVYLFSGISFFHIIAMTSVQSWATRQQTAIETGRRIQAKGRIRYFLELGPIEKFCFFSVCLMGAPFIFYRLFPNSPYLIYAALLQGSLICLAIANIKKFKLMRSTFRKFFAVHVVAALVFISVPGVLALNQFKYGTAQQKIESILFFGELTPKLDAKVVTTLFFGRKDPVNFRELKAVLDYQKIPQAIFTLDKDWNLFASLLKITKTADEITLALSFFSSKSMNESQITTILGEYARTRKGTPWTSDYLTLVQYPQPLDTMKRFLASPRKEVNRFALHLAAFQLDTSAIPEIQRELEHFDVFNQRYALVTLSVLQRKAIGLSDWRPVLIKIKEKGKTREIASVSAHPDYRRACDNYAIPDFKHELSPDQLIDLNVCVRYRARNADLVTKLKVDNLRWIEGEPDEYDVRTIKSAFSRPHESG